MSDDKKHITPGSQIAGHLALKGEPGAVYRSVRPKRRRKGQLNDGQWAPGYGPDVDLRAANPRRMLDAMDHPLIDRTELVHREGQLVRKVYLSDDATADDAPQVIAYVRKHNAERGLSEIIEIATDEAS